MFVLSLCTCIYNFVETGLKIKLRVLKCYIMKPMIELLKPMLEYNNPMKLVLKHR